MVKKILSLWIKIFAKKNVIPYNDGTTLAVCYTNLNKMYNNG